MSRNQLLAKAMRSIIRRLSRSCLVCARCSSRSSSSLAIVRPAAAVDYTDLWCHVERKRLGGQLRSGRHFHLRHVLHLRAGPAADLVHRADDDRTRMAYGRARCYRTHRDRTSARRGTTAQTTPHAGRYRNVHAHVVVLGNAHLQRQHRQRDEADHAADADDHTARRPLMRERSFPFSATATIRTTTGR